MWGKLGLCPPIADSAPCSIVLEARQTSPPFTVMAYVPERMYHVFGFHPSGDLGPLTFYTSKRGRLVFFPKAPPLSPPSTRQRHERNRFKLIAQSWNALAKDVRQRWSLAARKASLAISGYNLYVYYCYTLDRQALATIERQTGLTLDGIA